MKIRNHFLTFIFLITSAFTFACSCSQIKIVNAFSNLDFIGIVEFESIKRIENSYGAYASKVLVKELFKGNKNEKFIIDSQEGSSCSFLPEIKSEYFILGFKNEKGIIEISFCSAQKYPNKNELSILRNLVKKNEFQNISSNLNQTLNEEIDYRLFEKPVAGIFLYKVFLDSDLKIKEIIPENENAKKNFNEKIRNELKKKIYYQKNDEEIEFKKEILTSYIILNWEKNYENKGIITTSKL